MNHPFAAIPVLSSIPVPVLAMAAAFLVSAVSGRFIIPWLKRLKFGQVIREEGLKSHQSKAGTTIMGGLMFLLSTTVVGGAFALFEPRLLTPVLVTLGCGFVGFMDDWLKVAKKHNEGLKSWQKMGGLAAVAAAFMAFVLISGPDAAFLFVPFAGHGAALSIPVVLAVLLAGFILLASTNAVNLADGVDGLAGSVTLIVFVFFGLAVLVDDELSWLRLFCATVSGGILGFLLYNLHPAKIFMGDTGSLALGGAVGSVAVLSGMSLLLAMAGIVYVIETLSVLIQVGVYKRTKKRVFRMAPIHHHFELCGWKENRIVAVFSLVTAAASAVALLSLR